MAQNKRKRKPSKTQRDKYIISIVKQLKHRGILSKNTKLHGGKYVSYKAINAANKYQYAVSLNYKAHKVSKDKLQKAKDEGYEIVRGRYILGPATREFSKRLNEPDGLAGVKPVKGGYLETVVLPYNIYEIRQLYNAGVAGELDKLKLEDERFAFRFHGHLSYQTFRNTNELLKYLSHYRSIFDAAGDMRAEYMNETFKNLQVFRLAAGDEHMLIPSAEERKRMRKRTYKSQDRREESAYYKRLNKMHPDRAKREIKRNNIKSKERRDALKSDPKKLEEYRAKARARAKTSYQNRNKK